MPKEDIFGLIFMLIMASLLLANPNGTANVISSIGGFFTAETSTLQGNKNAGYTPPSIQTKSGLFG